MIDQRLVWVGAGRWVRGGGGCGGVGGGGRGKEGLGGSVESSVYDLIVFPNFLKV